MPIADPVLREIAKNALLKVKICMKCYARNPPSAVKCRRCGSKRLRWKKMKMSAKK
ncbi:MAG: 50S ribosomal protein L40e [Candidatus Njordarchaeia archaeon]|nr:50S ribosomal protein L40e [Candidatus Korarchaeota archaeon]